MAITFPSWQGIQNPQLVEGNFAKTQKRGRFFLSGFTHPHTKLKNISSNKKQLWVVAYVNQTGNSPLIEEAKADIDASFEGGADAVILINEWCALKELQSTLDAVRKQYPREKLGVNYLGDEAEPYGYLDSFRLSRTYDLSVVWTDFSGVDLINEKPPVDLHAIAQARDPRTFYCSGVHMKYSTLKDPNKTIEESALQAMGFVDGVIITGPKTGIASDPDKLSRARAVIGQYPLGVASGVSPENAHEILPFIDFCLVASSLQDEKKRIKKNRVRELRHALNN